LVSFIILLVLPRCLGMWTSIPAHIYPHLSKVRLLLKTNGGTNEQCLQWVLYMPGITVHDVMLLVYGIGHKAYMRVFLFPDCNRKEEASAPLGYLEALRSNRKF